MQVDVRTVAAIGLVAFALYSTRQGEPSTPGIPDAIPKPSADLLPHAEEIRGIVASDKATAKLAGCFFADAADVINRDTTISSTGGVRSWLMSSDTYRWQGTDIVGKFPGFGEAKDELIRTAIGNENVALDATKRARLVEALKAIAWACNA